MPVSEAQRKAAAKYLEKLDEIRIRMPKGRKDEIKSRAEGRGQSVNGFIIAAIDEKMERDGGEVPAPGAVPVERVLAEMPAGSPQEAAGATAGAGGISLSSDTLEAAQRAADAAGESVGDFIRRAVAAQAERDALEGLTLMDAAVKAAEATGETPAAFIVRAIETQAKRDKSSIALGINPTTGDKLKGEV